MKIFAKPYSLMAAAGLVLSLGLSGCVVAPVGSPEPVMVAPMAPPPPRVEVIPVAPAPSHLWINGYWDWGGAGYAWRPGYWSAPRAGYSWAPREWAPHRGGGWRSHGGHWHRR